MDELNSGIQERGEVIKWEGRTIKLLNKKTDIKQTGREMNRDSKACEITTKVLTFV